MDDFVMVYITAGSAAEAEKIARAVVGERLAACANILPGARSLYQWQGAIETSEEVVIIAKTRRSLADALTTRVRHLHSYDCPCVVVLPITGGNPAYLDWLAAETAPGPTTALA